jgi:hypothetical protein
MHVAADPIFVKNIYPYIVRLELFVDDFVSEIKASLCAVFVLLRSKRKGKPPDIAQGFADRSNQNHAQRAGCSRTFNGPWQGPTQLCGGA